MKKILIILFLILSCNNGYGQGYNHHWLLGSYNFFQDPKGRILFDSREAIPLLMKIEKWFSKAPKPI
jgi:hypothetical protein